MSPLTKLALLALAAFVVADNDCDSDSNLSSCISSGRSSSTVNGIVVTDRSTTTDVGRSTTLVPVLTQSVATTTDVGVATTRNTLTETTDIGTTPTNTIVQYGTTTDINLESGYAYTTDSSGHTSYVYTGSGTPSITPSAYKASGSSAMSSSTRTTGNMAAATAAPYLGAAIVAGGLAFAF